VHDVLDTASIATRDTGWTFRPWRPAFDVERLYGLSEIPEVPRRITGQIDAGLVDPSTRHASSALIPQG